MSVAIQERPPIPNRAEEHALITLNMFSLFDLIGKWNRAAEQAIKVPTPENQQKFVKYDVILRDLFALMPDLEKPQD